MSRPANDGISDSLWLVSKFELIVARGDLSDLEEADSTGWREKGDNLLETND